MSYSPRDTTNEFTKWTPCLAVYYKGSRTTIGILITGSNQIRISDGVTTVTASYLLRNLRDVVADLNAGTNEFIVKQLLDIGPEKMTSGAIIADDALTDRSEDGAYLLRFTSHIVRNKERNVIQLKPPRSVNRFESWNARIGKGTIRARFSDISFTSFPGVNPNAIYTFSIPEFIEQEWSVEYGPPYKDAVGEIPKVQAYNPVLSTSVIQVARTPIYFKNNNISIRLKGVNQPNNIIKHVDENNGLIFLSTKLDAQAPITVSYSFKEEDYVYDGIDLNCSVAHNPLTVDTFVAFYIKPVLADGAMISGGDAIYHEVLNTEVAGRHTVARVIPETDGTPNPVYEPVIYLGSINVRQAHDQDDIEIIDTRSRGGGLYEDPATGRKEWREAEFFFDIGSPDGVEVPGNSAIVIKVPQTVKDKGMSREEIVLRAGRHVALGVATIVDEDTL